MSAVLSHDRITADGAEPREWWYFLHGIFGAGRNWATVARKLVKERPGVGILLVDLRQHGTSQGFEAPHTVEAAAADLSALAAASGMAPVGVLGHSFGGKVALMYAATAPAALEQVWVIDSTPAPRESGGSAWEMLQIIKTCPDTFESRQDLIGRLVTAGVDAPVAQWMATNLEATGDRYRWRFDRGAIEALLGDFYDTDAWPVVESPPAGVELHFVQAERSSILRSGAEKRISAAGEASGQVHLHRVPGGHWVNADAPDELIALVLAHGMPQE